MRKIFKTTGVLLISAILLFTSIAVMADKIEEQKIYPRFLKLENSNIIKGNDVQFPQGDILFSQLPFEPWEDFTSYTSSIKSDDRVHDNYWDVKEPICNIHWWGFSLTWTGSQWIECDPEGMCFEIIFWDSLLENKTCEYTQVCPHAISTGKTYDGLEMLHWRIILDPCCDQFPDGWVSIQCISSPNDCYFLWAGSDDGDLYSYQEGYQDPDLDTDVAFEFTPPGPPPVPNIECIAVGMDFGKASPGEDVNGQIEVCNDGDPGTFLNWYVDTTNLPPWGTWKFTPSNGSDLFEPDCEIVNVVCTVTDLEDEYIGTITVYNADDLSNFCVVDTSIKVPRTKTLYHPLLIRLFKFLPNVFPILKHLLGI